MFILYLEAHKGHRNKAFSLFLSLCLLLSHGTNGTKSNYSIQQDPGTRRLTLNSEIDFSYFTRGIFLHTRGIHSLKILSSFRVEGEKRGEERLASSFSKNYNYLAVEEESHSLEEQNVKRRGVETAPAISRSFIVVFEHRFALSFSFRTLSLFRRLERSAVYLIRCTQESYQWQRRALTNENKERQRHPKCVSKTRGL